MKTESAPADHITVRDLTMAFGDYVVQQDLNFGIGQGDIFIIMGGSGCGKSTLLRHLIGLQPPVHGQVFYRNVDFWAVSKEDRDRIMGRAGILYQSGALWSSMTLAENVALPLETYAGLDPARVRDLVNLKLSLVGLAAYGDYYPSQISGGMRKRAGLARAMALDPEILFFDEPSAGLDPVSSRHLDDLILEINASLGTTLILVTHELASIFTIGTNGIFLDAERRTMIAAGSPQTMLKESGEAKVHEFLTRKGQAGFDLTAGA